MLLYEDGCIVPTTVNEKYVVALESTCHHRRVTMIQMIVSAESPHQAARLAQDTLRVPHTVKGVVRAAAFLSALSSASAYLNA